MAATAEPESQYDYERRLLREDTPVFARHCLMIVDDEGRPMRLHGKPEQLRFDAAVEAQRASGEPMRAIILKARKLGFSTWVQAKLIQRVTQFPYQQALVVAQDNRTAQALFNMGHVMWENLPDVDDIKPRKTGTRKGRSLELSNRSMYQSDSAKEIEAGRGLTLHSLHISEIASYWDAETKLLGLLNAVPAKPNTLVVIESTAKGHNHFKERWDDAVAGRSDYIAFFSPWFEEPSYRRGFPNDDELESFIASIGSGEVGEDEEQQIELMRSEDLPFSEIYEKLHWRRWKIANELANDLDHWRQEYPATPEEAFLATGRFVFEPRLVHKMKARVREAKAPETGTLEPKGFKPRVSRGVTVHIPTSVEFRQAPINDDRNPGWRIWEHPVKKTDDVPAGQYVIGGDASGGDEKEGASAYHVLSVCDHRTRRQVAEYRSKIDPDELALEAYKACLYFNMAWVAIEVTGSWGGPAMRRLAKDYRYPFVYQRQRLDSRSDKWEDRLGWHTGFAEKKLLIAEMREMLRNGDDGTLSRGLADEYGWYILDDRNRAKPEFGKTSDRLIARGISVCVAREKPLRPERKAGQVHSTIEGVTLGRAGYRVG